MGLTTKERVEREKQRRETSNARMREKVAAARRRGICRCGGKLDKKPGTRRNYSTCPKCREKGTAAATCYYREGPLPPRVIPPVKLDGRLRDSTGVRRRLERDGFGREAWWWIANININGRQSSRRWSVDKHGDRGAWRQAMTQRREWEEAAQKLKALFAKHTGLIIASPEYNSTLTAALKNAIDWVSRATSPGEEPLSVLKGKSAAILSASPGGYGGARSLAALRPFLENIQISVLPDQVSIPKAHEAFNADGNLIDPAQDAAVRALAAALMAKLA